MDSTMVKRFTNPNECAMRGANGLASGGKKLDSCSLARLAELEKPPLCLICHLFSVPRKRREGKKKRLPLPLPSWLGGQVFRGSIPVVTVLADLALAIAKPWDSMAISLPKAHHFR